MRLPAAERRRPWPGDGIIAALVIAAAVVLLLLLRPASGDVLTATVLLDGAQVGQYDLSGVEQSFLLPLEGTAYPVVIELQPGRVRVAESGCPSQDCVHTGWADSPGEQIICLPNRLVISLSGTDHPDFDGVTG